MKKVFSLLASVLMLVSITYWQSQRMVLLEEFTSSTCGPCVTANSKIHGWLVQYPTTFTAIFYHMNWPPPGNDPMYLANPVDNNARRSYYNVNSVPNSVVDGNVYNGNGNSLQWSVISNRANVPSPFEIQLQHTLSPAQDIVYLTMVAKATQTAVGNLVAHNVVIEKLVHFTNPPGSNGETNFDHVMKKMLPTKDGTQLPDYEPGDYSIIQTSWVMANVYDVDEIAGVGFIQNNTTKEVLQSANSSANFPTLPYNRDLQVMSVQNVYATNCSGAVAPVVTVRNNGNNTITSFDLNFNVNGGTVSTQGWTGSIAPLETTSVTLPGYTFTPQLSNTLQIYSNHPNSSTDEYPKNDTLTIPISGAEATSLTLYLFIKTDNNPQETTWDIKDAGGLIVASGGPYTTPNIVNRDTIEIPAYGCYTFTIYDAGGNGICCNNGNGLYLLQDDLGTEIVEGGNFGAYQPTEFNANLPSAIEVFDQTRALRVFPNPANGSATAAFYLPDPGTAELSLKDMTGRNVWSARPGYLPEGDHRTEIDLTGVVPGIYFLQLTTGNKVYTRKVTVNR